MSADRDIGALEARVAALDEPIRQWRDARERAFAAQFRPREGQLSTLMSRLPKAAAAAKSVGAGPREAAFALLDEICDLYLRSDPQQCALIRAVVHQHELGQLLDDYTGHAREVLDMGGRPEWLDRALAAASIDDQGRDYRDWLISLGDVYLAGWKHKLDVTEVLKRVGALSNPESRSGPRGATRYLLGSFEETAYFATSVLPRLR